jgi:hypothetical protein
MSLTVHRLFYGSKNGYDLQTSPELKAGLVVNEDVKREIYNDERLSPCKSKLYYTNNGPVISITRVERSQNYDKRVTIQNKTLLIKLSDIVAVLTPFLDQEFDKPLEPLKLEVTEACKSNGLPL